MRRHDRESGIEAAKKILASAEYGVLSMSSRDGAPHGVPLNFAFAEDGIFFHCAQEGAKIDLISENPKVSFCAVGGTEVQPAQFATKYESVIVTGRVEELFAEDKHRGLVLLLQKYSADHMKEGLEYIARDIDLTKVFRIRIESITGKARL
jgi:uncharacterized protein